jgi:hypothetical protein
VTGYDPLQMEVGPWIELGRDLLHARSPRDLMGALLMPPGRRADGPGETSEELRGRTGNGAGPARVTQTAQTT